MTRIVAAVGGRKVLMGIGAAALLTAMAPVLGADYGTYAAWLCAALGITSGSVAYEDSRRKEEKK